MSEMPDDTNLPPPGLPPNSPPDPLAVKLARLDPAPPALSRDRVLFRAGAESRRNVIRLWQVTAGFLAAMGFYAGTQFRGEKLVYVDRPVAPAPAATAAEPKPQPPAPKADDTAAATPAPAAVPPAVPPAPPDGSENPGPAEPFFVNVPDPGGAVGWFQMRNEVLLNGLGLLPNHGRNPPPPRTGTDPR